MFVGPQWRLLRFPGVAIWENFEVLGELVTYSFYYVEATTKIKSYLHLCTYPRKVLSAWAEVWRIPWSSVAPITVFEFLG